MDPAPSQSLGSQASQAWSPIRLDPWLVAHLLGDPERPGTTEHLVQIQKVWKEKKHHNLWEPCPTRVLHITDGAHDIRAVVDHYALLQSPFFLSLSGPPIADGQLIVLKNYRVCFREAAQLEDCEFYLALDSFQVTGTTMTGRHRLDCNKEPLVLKKRKELCAKYALNILKQTAKECLDLFDSANQLDSEPLAVYPDTKWQVQCRQDKPHQDTFTVPSKFLGNLKKNQVIEAMEGAPAAGGKAVAVKQKRAVSLKFVNLPKKSRAEVTQVQHHPVMEFDRETPQGHEGNAGGTAEGGPNAVPNQQIGASEEERVRVLLSHVTYEPPTPELCAQVRSARISRGLLGWAHRVFTKPQAQ